MSENRAARRRREREEARLYKTIDRQYSKADRVAARLLPQLQGMLDEAGRRAWGDVAVELQAAIAAVHAGEGLDLKRHMARAAELIDAHEPPTT